MESAKVCLAVASFAVVLRNTGVAGNSFNLHLPVAVRGGKETTLTPGQTFYEGPDDVHVVGRNASKTEPPKFVVFFVKDKGVPMLVPFFPLTTVMLGKA